MPGLSRQPAIASISVHILHSVNRFPFRHTTPFRHNKRLSWAPKWTLKRYLTILENNWPITACMLKKQKQKKKT
jgi:hypothetical protein